MTRPTAAATFSALALGAVLLTGCGGSTDVEIVAGGGGDPQAAEAAQIQICGLARDMAVSDGTVYLLADRGEYRYEEVALLVIEDDGSVTEAYVTDPEDASPTELRYVAAANESVYVAGGGVIYRVAENGPEPVYEAPDDEYAPSIRGVAVSPGGEPIWSENFWNGGERGGSYLGRIQRLSGESVGRVAGVDRTTVAGEEIRAGEADPPDDVRATDMPLSSAGYHGTLAADADGNVYAATDERSILRFAPDGGVDLVSGRGESPIPDKPLDDEGPAAEFGGNWQDSDLLELTDVTASDGRVAAVDGSPSNGPKEATDFRWNPTGDIDDSRQQVLDEIGEAYPVDDGYYPGGFAVVIDDGTAATVAGHAVRVALDGDTLYIAGQTGAYLRDSEILVVAVDLTATMS